MRTRIVTALVVGPLLVAGLALARPSVSGAASYKLVKVGEAEKPIQVLPDPRNGALLVVEKTGRVRELADGKLGPARLDVSNDVSNGNEQGLLGVAFSPNGEWLYTNHTDTDGDTRITAYPWSANGADSEKAVELLKVEQPYSNHNGGGLDVTADGVLWIGLGDGGSGGDPQNFGQNRNSLLGKILRILPTPTAARPYSIPTGNQRVENGDNRRPEIWAYGLRNPWRFDVDEPSKTVWIGDVGQNAREEINAYSLTSTRTDINFGWKLREGFRPFEGGKKPVGAIDPIHDYAHPGGGCSVTGGLVYRGTELTALRGMYLFTDYCKSDIRKIDPKTKRATSLGAKAKSVSSFGVDNDGEILVMSLDGPIYRLAAG